MGTTVFTDLHRLLNRAGRSKKLVVRVYIVRHGETQENRDGVIQGQRDTLLNENGEEQAWMVAEALKDASLGAAFSSDLSRAVKVSASTTRSFVDHSRFMIREVGLN